MLIKRVISAVLLAAFIILAIFTFPNWMFSLLVACFVGIGLYEFFNLVGKKGIFTFKYFGIILGVLVPVILYLKLGGIRHDVEPFYIVLASLVIFAIQFTKRENNQALIGISVTLLGLLYISWFFSYIIKIKFLPNGANLVFFLLLVTKFGDVGAYFIGTKFGRHSLIPRISPKKSVEGTIGGLITSLAVALISRSYLPNVPYLHLAILGLLLGALGQVGDLAESLIKRDCMAKDSGNLLPGLGGMLDMLDSLLFTIPIFYFYVTVVPCGM